MQSKENWNAMLKKGKMLLPFKKNFNSYKHTPTILPRNFNLGYLFKRNENTQRPVWRSFRSFILNCQNLEISQMSIIKRTGKKKVVVHSCSGYVWEDHNAIQTLYNLAFTVSMTSFKITSKKKGGCVWNWGPYLR